MNGMEMAWPSKIIALTKYVLKFLNSKSISTDSSLPIGDFVPGNEPVDDLTSHQAVSIGSEAVTVTLHLDAIYWVLHQQPQVTQLSRILQTTTIHT